MATPIGNLNDISLRALDILKTVDVIAVEHIQNSKYLLMTHGISVPLISLHQHNEVEAANKILTLLTEGKRVALITDAGTPAISDPGAILVQQVRAKNFPVIPIPGANAAICALSAAGITNPHFFFYGFLPTKSIARQRELVTFKSQSFPTIFYEAPHRIIECIEDMIEVFGANRILTLARELTKIFETIHVSSLADTLNWLKLDLYQQKGEFVLILSGAEKNDKSQVSEQARDTLRYLLADLPLKQAVKLAATITGENKSTLYQLALRLKQSDQSE